MKMKIIPLFPSLLMLLPSLASGYLKYNEIRQKDSHNSYERREGMLDQMIYHLLRTVEIDSHLGFTSDLYSVYHDAGYFQSYSSFNRLRDGVKMLLEFHDMFPNHQVVTVFMDLKGGFKGDLHTPEGFDYIIGQLPLWTPAEAMGNATSIRDGIDRYGWPEIDDLRGKFIWVLTTGMDDYCDNGPDCAQRLSFVSGKSVPAKDIGKEDRFVFYNQKWDYLHTGPTIFEKGYVGRIWHPEDMDNEEKWQQAKANRFQHLTTDKINYHRDPYNAMHNAYGYPFETMNGLDVSQFTLDDEGADIIYMYANPEEGGDAWGRRDNIHFAYNQGSKLFAGMDQYDWIEYTTSISLVNSHCDMFAKAGIMLREEDPQFPLGSGQYFGVMRTCGELIRVQYRERAYMLTVSKRLQPTLADGIEQAKRIGIKIRYRYDGKDSYCEGYFKLEGRTSNLDDSYVLIEKQVFPDAQLTAHGLFTSNHHWKGNDDDTPFKAIFVNTKRNGITMKASHFPLRGGDYDRRAFGDGYFPDPRNSDNSTFVEIDETANSGRRRLLRRERGA